MDSFVALIHTQTVPENSGWMKDPENTFKSISTLEKGCFLMEQCLILGHYRFAYDGNVTKQLDAYASFVTKLLELYKMDQTHDRNCYSFCNYLLGNAPKPMVGISVETIDRILTGWSGNEVNPSQLPTSFYIPTSHFMLSKSASLNGMNAFNNIRSFEHHSVSIPSLTLIGRYAQIEFVEVGSYKFDCEALNSIGSYNESTSYFGFMSCIKFDTNNLMSIVSTLSNLVTDNDIASLSSIRGNGLVFHNIKSKCLGIGYNNIGSEDYKVYPNVKARLVSFISYLSRQSNTSFEGIEKLAEIMFDVTNSQEALIVGYLKSKDKSLASIEEYTAFKSSFLGNIKAITSMEAAEDEAPEGDEEPPADEEDMPDETTDEFGTDEGDELGGPDNTSDSTGFGTSSSSEEPVPTETEEEGLELGDEKGITIELAKGETLNTYIFRKELGQHITAILNAPPKFLDSIQLQYLKHIKMYWINLLSIKCVTDMISRVVKIPIFIKLKATK